MRKKIAFIKQKDSMQCGLACLGMITSIYGKAYSLSFLSQYCHASADGISMLGIIQGAKALGLESMAVKISTEQLMSIGRPCILHWDQNHFVVMYNTEGKGKSFCIADPAKGKYRVSEQELIRHWIYGNGDNDNDRGMALYFEPTDDFFNADDVSEDYFAEKRSFSVLLKYLRSYHRYFFQIFLGLLLACILQLIFPFLTQTVVDIGIHHEDIGFIWLILIGELMIVIGRTATDFVRRWLLLHISMRINISLVSDFFIKLLKLPMSFFDTKLTGDIMQRINDHSRIQSFLTNQVLGAMFSLMSFLVFGVVLLIYDRLVFLVFIIATLIYGLWVTFFLSRRKLLDYELFGQLALNQNMTYQFVTNMQEIKLQDCERRRRWEWEDVQADLFNVQMKSLKLQQTQEAGSIFINEVKNIIITVFAATSVINGDMTLGGMLAVQYVIGQLNSPVEQLMAFVYSLQDVKISLERINEIHEGRNEESAPSAYVSFDNQKKTIEVEAVDFKYDPHALENTISGVSIKIPHGKVTAIVGTSGSGKTTLIKLMLGYYGVSGGRINIAGRNISSYNLKWWRRQCGVVMQDGVIFSESIARNIAVDDNDIDYDRLQQAAMRANIHEYVMSLPLGYSTKIGRDGVGLSQGQKQRILIARAVYKDPDFIFLDEATNALDAKNERAIVENLNEFYKGRTVVVVAHRLSTVRNADQIIVLDGGKVVETGSHATLIENKGAYYNLVKNQLELGN